MHRRSLSSKAKALLIAMTLATVVGCGDSIEEEGVAGTEDGLTNALSARVETTLKTSTIDSIQLPPERTCRIEKGTSIKLGNATTVGRHVRGRVAAPIPQCADKPAFAVGQQIYVFNDHFSGSNPSSPERDLSGTSSCSPERAVGAVGRYTKAMLDAIAFAEGTKGRGQDGYNIIFTYKVTSSCDRHPRQLACSGGLCSDAAGRYQFLSTTWDGLGLRDFTPGNQERGASSLISRRGVSLPSSRALSATEFSNAMNVLSYEWASLPPGRYGQPNYSVARMRQEYCAGAGC